MLTNKEIKNLLSKNWGDNAKFARFLKISREALYYRLKRDAPKDNLYGKYIEFLLTLKEKGNESTKI